MTEGSPFCSGITEDGEPSFFYWLAGQGKHLANDGPVR